MLKNLGLLASERPLDFVNVTWFVYALPEVQSSVLINSLLAELLSKCKQRFADLAERFAFLRKILYRSATRNDAQPRRSSTALHN